MARVKRMAPADARNFNDLCKLRKSWIESGDFSIHVDAGSRMMVSLTEQVIGEPQKQFITMPKRNFDALVRCYLTGSKRLPKPRSKR